MNYFNVLKDLKQVITTDISMTTRNSISLLIRTRLQGWNQYLKFSKIEYYTYKTTENKEHGVLLRRISSEVTAEMVLIEVKQLEYPAIHVRQVRRTICDENLQQSNSLFLSLYLIMYTVEENTCNTRDTTCNRILPLQSTHRRL
jgi:hypothetical protein